ncbi:PepSY-associated TM helix domain-containing protein [Sphingobium sp. Sx8-8]|uniref:PepSY-associated TM helix domain-containing protein n=1 Tax=Sphingobium sp. Sx8-8 TaxID=2933617 RepID=UPI001F564290|nr:PepSY-associated TM helix domain-containing protein [Sphingobium sp. Sx8-8]
MSRTLVQRGLSAHAAIGLLASTLLYIVCLTGSVTVFYEEWQRIEQPDAPEMARIAPEAVQAGIAHVLAAEKGRKATGHLYVHLPTDALPRTTVTTDHQAVHLDERGDVAGRELNGWSEFLLNLHYTLNIPGIVGLTLVGGLGVMMIALSLTGVIAHPRIFRDAFRLRARDRGGIGLADWHNRLGVWTLPFALAVALTGAMIGLATVNGYGLARSFYKGDLEAAYAPIFGAEGRPDPKAAPLADVATALRVMAGRFPDARPSYVILHEPGTAGQQVQILALHQRRLIYGENYMFDRAGRYRGHAGLSDGAAGQQVAASAYNLHFGNYGGLAVKIAYALLGTALTVVIATGTSIWLGKRERRGYRQPRLRQGWNAIVWGTGVALALTLLARRCIGNEAPYMAIFWAALALMLAVSVALPERYRVRRALQIALAACLTALFPAMLLPG